jgi:hypothetical protein
MIYSTCTAQRTRPNLPHIALLKGSSASETACVLTAHRVARAVPIHDVPQDVAGARGGSNVNRLTMRERGSRHLKG